nr:MULTISPECIES: hypothetical protein [unclassified Actinomyces]
MVGDALQVGGDVGGQQDAAPLLDEELAQDVEDLEPCDRVQARGRLVQDEEVGLVGEGQGQLELDALAA